MEAFGRRPPNKRRHPTSGRHPKPFTKRTRGSKARNPRETYAYGFDAQTGEFGDLIAKGIIDPTKVVRTAVQDAASIASLLITTEAMVAERPRKDMAPLGHPHPPHGADIDF